MIAEEALTDIALLVDAMLAQSCVLTEQALRSIASALKSRRCVPSALRRTSPRKSTKVFSRQRATVWASRASTLRSKPKTRSQKSSGEQDVLAEPNDVVHPERPNLLVSLLVAKASIGREDHVHRLGDALPELVQQLALVLVAAPLERGRTR